MLTCTGSSTFSHNDDPWRQKFSLLSPPPTSCLNRSFSNLFAHRAKALKLWRQTLRISVRRYANTLPWQFHTTLPPNGQLWTLQHKTWWETLKGTQRQVFFEVVAVFKWLTTQSPPLHCTNVSATEMTILFSKCLTFYTALNQMLKWNGLTHYPHSLILSGCSISCSFALLLYLKHKSSVPRLSTRN